MSRVSIVVPNYNGLSYLVACLDSLKEQTFTDSEVIVVDNGSTEEGMTSVMDDFSWVKWVEREENGGFSVAVNAGIRAAASPYIILLNNDTCVKNDFVEQLVTSIEEKKDAFSVQAKLVSMKEPERIDDAGDFYTVLGWAYARGKGREASKFDKSGRIFAACAGAAIYRKSILEEIGLFDENHFAYLEDIDIGYRAKLSGYNNYYEPRAVCEHYGSAASGSRYNEFKVRLAARNSVYLIYKNQPVWQRVLLFGFHLLGFLIKQVFFARKGLGGCYHDAVMEAYRTIKGKEKPIHKLKFGTKEHGRAFRIGFEILFASFGLVNSF